MLRTLLESNARQPQRRAGLAASVIVHTLLIGGALAATASARFDERSVSPPKQIVIYVPPAAPIAARQPPAKGAATADRPSAPHLARPAIDLELRFDADSTVRGRSDVDLRRVLTSDTGWAICAIGCRRRIGSPAPAVEAPATLATVDKAAALVSPPRPRYPDVLRSAGVTGRVVVRLVVDTLGRVELETVVVGESSHDLFAQAVLAVLPRLRFRSAEVAGRKVRMLVALPFEFRLDDRAR